MLHSDAFKVFNSSWKTSHAGCAFSMFVSSSGEKKAQQRSFCMKLSKSEFCDFLSLNKCSNLTSLMLMQLCDEPCLHVYHLSAMLHTALLLMKFKNINHMVNLIFSKNELLHITESENNSVFG